MAVHDLRNKRVLITGAGSGIGRAAALAFVRQQAHVIASDIEPSALQALRDEIEALGGACSIYTVDVADASAMQRFAAQMAQDGGAPDVLINNAGIGYLGQFLKSDLAHWRRVLDINLMGVVNGCHHFLPLMLAAGGPRQVLNVASTAGLYPAPAMAAYAASKFAVFGFSEVLKMELDGSQIGVTTVCPGVINTPIVRARH
ncbi:MAG TPA: SDR family NAD(P)-dependent oxidoreductase, partial [Burkholderiaceae bacterium]